MSDSSLTLSCSVNGTTYTTNINSALAAINSMRSGTSAPTNNIVDGTLWLDNSSSDNKIKIRIGSTWHNLFDFDGSNFYAEQAKVATKLETARTIGGVSFNGTANVNLPGVNATGNQNTSGSAAKLATARTVTLSGDVSGSTTFDGSSNVSITATVADDSHNHVVGNLDNFTEEVQDIIGGMVTGNTESNITVTYEDGDGTLDFSVPTPDISGTSLGGVLGGTVGNASIDNNAVGTLQINNSAVTNAKLASGISSSKLTGALPAIDGSALTGIEAGFTWGTSGGYNSGSGTNSDLYSHIGSPGVGWYVCNIKSTSSSVISQNGESSIQNGNRGIHVIYLDGSNDNKMTGISVGKVDYRKLTP